MADDLDPEALSRLRDVFRDHISRCDKASSSDRYFTEIPYCDDGLYFPPDYVGNTPPPAPVGPPAKVYAEGGAVFDPESDAYDYLSAGAAGLRPELDDIDGFLHWPSRDPSSGLILKGRRHPTWNEAMEADQALGFSLVPSADGRYYSLHNDELIGYAGGGAVDMLDAGLDDYGAGRFTRTPAERREVRERRIDRHVPERSEEWDRYIDVHGGNPLSYAMEALGRLDRAAGAAREGEHGLSARDYWDFASPDPQFRRDYGLPGAVADGLSIGSFGAAGKIGKALGWAAPLIYGAGEETLSAMGFAGGGKVSRLIKEIGKKFGDFQASRVERAADETNLDRISMEGLRSMFDPSEPRLFVNMPPGDFQDYASRIPASASAATPYPRAHNAPGADRLPDAAKTQEWYLDNLARYIDRRGTYSAPELHIARNPDDLSSVIEHEGRHRMMVMDRLSDPRSVVQLQLHGARPFDWSDMDPEGRVDWLTERYFPKLGKSLVVPQDRPTPRPLYSEPYAGGGKVLSTIERLVSGKPKSVKLPGGEALPAYPISEFEDVAKKFADRYGNTYPIEEFPAFDEDRARKIATAYEAMSHDPTNPRVRRAYDALIQETMDQYRALENTGVRFEFLKPGEGDPYALSPSLGYRDLLENGRLKVFPTEQGFGTLSDVSDNPLLTRVGRVGDLDNATANDAFRVVHDALGHFGPGNPFFRHQGEERAWMLHGRSYSPDALPAATSETRGQNSWLNFGPYGDRNRTALGADTVFADQKTGLLPEWMYEPETRRYRDGGKVLKAAKKFLIDPLRESFPGIYKDPDVLAREAEGGPVDDDFDLYHVSTMIPFREGGPVDDDFALYHSMFLGV